MGARICVGRFAGAHGVRGLVKLRSFTSDPAAVVTYGPLSDESGRREFRVSLLSHGKDAWLTKVDGIATREAAQALAGVDLYVDRAALPAPDDDDEFYQADLIGLRVELDDGRIFGTVRAVHDFGGGEILEIATPTGTVEMLPFTRAAVPVVDIAGGRLVADPPLAIEVREDFEDGPEAEETP
jgi:16S rRNA processing protein RimM